MNGTQIKKLAIAAMLLAIGYVLPFFTGQIQQIGNMLLPMHLPVMLAGLILGWQYGLAVGFITPITRSLIFGMPMLYPGAVAMAFELATY
jgi:predicted membrane protein